MIYFDLTLFPSPSFDMLRREGGPAVVFNLAFVMTLSLVIHYSALEIRI